LAMPRLRDTEFEGGSKNKRRDKEKRSLQIRGGARRPRRLGYAPFVWITTDGRMVVTSVNGNDDLRNALNHAVQALNHPSVSINLESEWDGGDW
jgi:hypothetical protein